MTAVVAVVAVVVVVVVRIVARRLSRHARTKCNLMFPSARSPQPTSGPFCSVLQNHCPLAVYYHSLLTVQANGM